MIFDKFCGPLGDEFDEDEINAKCVLRYVTGKSINSALPSAIHISAQDVVALPHGAPVHAANLSNKRQAKKQDIVYQPRLERICSLWPSPAAAVADVGVVPLYEAKYNCKAVPPSKSTVIIGNPKLSGALPTPRYTSQLKVSSVALCDCEVGELKAAGVEWFH